VKKEFFVCAAGINVSTIDSVNQLVVVNIVK